VLFMLSDDEISESDTFLTTNETTFKGSNVISNSILIFLLQECKCILIKGRVSAVEANAIIFHSSDVYYIRYT
jgi:hypothetical protein